MQINDIYAPILCDMLVQRVNTLEYLHEADQKRIAALTAETEADLMAWIAERGGVYA